MRPYSQSDIRYKKILRSRTKTAKLIASNADRSYKKRVRRRAKKEIKEMAVVGLLVP